MKVLLTGTIFVGKTTVLNGLKDANIPNVSYIPEFAREVLEQNFDLLETQELQDLLFAEQVRRETTAAQTGSFVICDRGSVDIIAHSRIFGHPIKNEWQEWARSYDKVLWFDKDHVQFDHTKYPGDRNWNVFRDLLDRQIRETLRDLGVTPLVLPSDGDERIAFISSMLDRGVGVETPIRFKEK